MSEQYRRQHLSGDWRAPKGFERYQYQKALLDEMNVLGGASDLYGSNPDRYSAPPPLD